jgi:hypothetical protein
MQFYDFCNHCKKHPFQKKKNEKETQHKGIVAILTCVTPNVFIAWKRLRTFENIKHKIFQKMLLCFIRTSGYPVHNAHVKLPPPPGPSHCPLRFFTPSTPPPSHFPLRFFNPLKEIKEFRKKENRSNEPKFVFFIRDEQFWASIRVKGVLNRWQTGFATAWIEFCW